MYATIDDMTNRFALQELVELTDGAEIGAVNSTIVSNALADAADLINSYVGKLYVVPITAHPAILTRYQCEIARYNLWANKDAMPDIVAEQYKAAIKWLTDVSNGRAIINAEGIAATQPEGSIEMVAPGRIMSRHSLEGF